MKREKYEAASGCTSWSQWVTVRHSSTMIELLSHFHP